jgi:hypothetical protein
MVILQRHKYVEYMTSVCGMTDELAVIWKEEIMT